MAKEFFRQNNISYKEIDVSMDEQKAREMIRKSGQMGVPVIEIDDKIIIGFNKPKIIQILGLK
jgi:glutaredoxin